MLDSRVYMHFYGTGITPAMTKAPAGKGSQYAIAYLDGNGDALDGAKIYSIHLPADVPANDFWSFTLYDNQTRSMLQTDQRFPGLDNNKEGLQQNADGSYDIYFGPQAPEGKQANWIQTVSGRGGTRSSVSTGGVNPGSTRRGARAIRSWWSRCGT